MIGTPRGISLAVSMPYVCVCQLGDAVHRNIFVYNQGALSQFQIRLCISNSSHGHIHLFESMQFVDALNSRQWNVTHIKHFNRIVWKGP